MPTPPIVKRSQRKFSEIVINQSSGENYLVRKTSLYEEKRTFEKEKSDQFDIEPEFDEEQSSFGTQQTNLGDDYSNMNFRPDQSKSNKKPRKDRYGFDENLFDSDSDIFGETLLEKFQRNSADKNPNCRHSDIW